uniref:amidase family protein n=1 Tax=Nocardia cyriacigeorgica TaxID=135487 RepID=UPI002455244A
MTGLPGNALPGSPTARVAAAYRRIAEVDRPEVWITLRPEAEVTADAAAIEQRRSDGERLPLAGLLVAVKDNVDVAGLPTTAACPAFAYTPEVAAAAGGRGIAGGGLVVGKTKHDKLGTARVGRFTLGLFIGVFLRGCGLFFFFCAAVIAPRQVARAANGS